MDEKDSDFGGQWIEIFRAGRHVDNHGEARDVGIDFLEAAVLNLDTAIHQPPAVIGHPEDNKPAYGWTEELRVNGGKLEARLGQVDPGFEELVRSGRLKKRSASFYIDADSAP